VLTPSLIVQSSTSSGCLHHLVIIVSNLNTKFSNDKNVEKAVCNDYKEGKGEDKEDKKESMKNRKEIKEGAGGGGRWQWWGHDDTLLSHRVNPLEGFTLSSCGKLRLRGTLPTSNTKKG
jgi:hypothetical protein